MIRAEGNTSEERLLETTITMNDSNFIISERSTGMMHQLNEMPSQ